jgi:acyl carrier protein
MIMTTLESVRTFIVTNFYVPETITLGDDTSLLELGIVDSTGVLEVTAFLESEYGIEVADDEFVPANMDSIKAIAAFVETKAARAA